MDGRQAEYSQSGLSSPYPRYNEQHSEATPPDQSSAVQYSSGAGQDYKSSNFSSSATPDSGYGLPQSARSSSFPDYVQRSYAADGQQSRYPQGAQTGHAAMAQTSNPSIAQSSPSYPPPHNYSPYPPAQHDMGQYPPQSMPYARPEWGSGYGAPMQYGASPSTQAGAGPGMNSIARPPHGGQHLSTVYSFVPIPGAQQHKRPRRRYEEIERMYKCGWNGCEKAYGTLNHLNAHVTMQSHGSKRTPEEFKEIRKEWKAKKKEEEAARKADEERHRQDPQRGGEQPGQQPGQYGAQHMMAPAMGPGGPQLPPLGYQNAGSGQQSQYGQPQQTDGAPSYSYSQGYPQSPYGQVPYQQQGTSGSQYQQQ